MFHGEEDNGLYSSPSVVVLWNVGGYDMGL